MPRLSIQGHSGELILDELPDKTEKTLHNIYYFAGRVHSYEGIPWNEVTFQVKLISAIGWKLFILTNASGGLFDDMTGGCLCLLTGHVIKIVVFRQHSDVDVSDISTIIIKGATNNLIDKIERAIDDSVNVYKSLAKDQITDIKCYTCKILICIKCALYKHKQHDHILIQDCIKEDKEELIKLLNEGKEKINEIKLLNENLQQLRKLCQINDLNSLQDIDLEINKLKLESNKIKINEAILQNKLYNFNNFYFKNKSNEIITKINELTKMEEKKELSLIEFSNQFEFIG
ncbi:hypothetical protein ABK040_013093 [Willaertia magna]